MVNRPLENFSKGVASVTPGNDRQYSRNSSMFTAHGFLTVSRLDATAATGGQVLVIGTLVDLVLLVTRISRQWRQQVIQLSLLSLCHLNVFFSITKLHIFVKKKPLCHGKTLKDTVSPNFFRIFVATQAN